MNYFCRYCNIGGGFVKKSFPFPKLSLQKRIRRLLALSNSRRILRKQKKREKACEDSTKDVALEDREARYRKARILLKNAIAKVKERKVRSLHIHVLQTRIKKQYESFNFIIYLSHHIFYYTECNCVSYT